jgi:beta-lactam-binding protein with PASTA domain
VPRAFEAIVAKLLTKDPNVRYSTADAVREDLRRFRNGETPVALQAAGAARSTAQTPTVVGPVSPGPGSGNGHNRPSQQMTAVQRTQVAGPGGPRTAQRPPTGSLPQVGYDEPPKRTGWYALAAFFAIIALGIGGFLLFNTLTGDSDPPSTRALPNYVEQELQAVKDDLTSRGLVPVPISNENDTNENGESANVEPGQVYRTDPGQGVVVASGSSVRVFYREIETTATIPDLRGQTEAAARAALEQLGFVNITVQFEVNDDEPDGTVIATDPAAGQEIRVTDEITLTVARASGEPGTDTEAPTTTAPGNQVSVPMVIGQSENRARQLLSDAGLEFDISYFETRDNQWIGNVMDQSPRRGATALVGDTVQLTIGVEPDEPEPTNPPQTNPPQTNPPPTNPPPTQAPTTTAAPTTTQAATTTTTVPEGG